MENIDQAVKLINENENLDMTVGEMKEFLTLFEDRMEKSNMGDALFSLIEEVYSFGLGIGYQAGAKKDK